MTAQGLGHLQDAIASMRLGKLGDRIKPHKPLMLLAVLDLVDAGLIEDNRIHYSQDLVERFQEYFEAVKQEGDWCQPAPPFFHLRSSSFWRHKAIEGREDQYAMLHSSGGGSRRIVDNVEYAFLSEDAYAIVSNLEHRVDLREFILDTFFSVAEQEALREVMGQEREISLYEAVLEQRRVAQARETRSVVRSAAFRRVVLRSYDYQCAMCGLRIVIPDIQSPIDAAHLIPWHATQDDSPSNGMALCKLHHWALDTHLVAPTTDYYWRVSDVLDKRRNSERELTRFDGLPILMPRNENAYPSKAAVRWRLIRLAR